MRCGPVQFRLHLRGQFDGNRARRSQRKELVHHAPEDGVVMERRHPGQVAEAAHQR